MGEPVPQEIERLKDVIVPILSPLGVRRIGVFGSAARGEATAASDIDILVELERPEDRPPIGLKWFRVERQLSEALGRAVDLVSSAGLHPLIRIGSYTATLMLTLSYCGRLCRTTSHCSGTRSSTLATGAPTPSLTCRQHSTIDEN